MCKLSYEAMTSPTSLDESEPSMSLTRVRAPLRTRRTFRYDLETVDQRAIHAASNLSSGSELPLAIARPTADTVKVAMKNTSFRSPGSRHHDEAVLLGTLLKAKSPPMVR